MAQMASARASRRKPGSSVTRMSQAARMHPARATVEYMAPYASSEGRHQPGPVRCGSTNDSSSQNPPSVLPAKTSDILYASR